MLLFLLALASNWSKSDSGYGYYYDQLVKEIPDALPWFL